MATKKKTTRTSRAKKDKMPKALKYAGMAAIGVGALLTARFLFIRGTAPQAVLPSDFDQGGSFDKNDPNSPMWEFYLSAWIWGRLYPSNMQNLYDTAIEKNQDFNEFLRNVAIWYMRNDATGIPNNLQTFKFRLALVQKEIEKTMKGAIQNQAAAAGVSYEDYLVEYSIEKMINDQIDKLWRYIDEHGGLTPLPPNPNGGGDNGTNPNTNYDGVNGIFGLANFSI